MRREVDDVEAVEVGDLHEHPLGRAVGIGLERDRPHAVVERHASRPAHSCLTSMTVICRPAIDPATTNLPSGVTNVLWMPPLVGMRLDASCSDAVSMTSTAPGCRDDGDVDALAVLRDREVVRAVAQRDVPADLQRLGVDDVEPVLRLVGDVEAAAVGRGGGAVVDFDAVDLADDLVGRGSIR